jgi:hypothetical protein
VELVHVHGRGSYSKIAVDYRFVPVVTFRCERCHRGSQTRTWETRFAWGIVRMDRYDAWDAATGAIGAEAL